MAAAPNYDVDTVDYAKLSEFQQIGEGGFGKVYRAKHADWGPVAFKELLVTFINENQRSANELREVRMHCKLRHQNVITLMGVVFERGHYGVILEYAAHGDLWRFIGRFHPVPWAWKLKMASGIVLGMNYLHTVGKQLIHGDLKMKNVLVSEGFNPKISDFGLSRWKQYSKEMSRRPYPGGTVTHIPPENWQNINIAPSEKYDVYSFGILLWELLSENHPFTPVADTNAIKDTVLSGRRPQMNLISADVPDFLKKVVQKCWVQSPGERPFFRALKPELEGYVDAHKNSIDVAKQKLQLLEMHGLARDPGHAAPPNVPTGGPPVGVVDPGTARLPYSVGDASALGFTARSRPLHQPGVAVPTHPEVKTNEGLANIHPANSGLDSSAAAYSAQPSIDLNPGIVGGGASSGSDQTFRSDQSVAQRMEQMELSSGENQQRPQPDRMEM